MEHSGRAKYYDSELLKYFPAKMRKLPKTQKVPFADALSGITNEEFDQAINSLSKTDEGKKIAISIERSIRKVQEYRAKNYFTMSEIKEIDTKMVGKKSVFGDS